MENAVGKEGRKMTNQLWTKEEDEILSLYYTNDKSNQEILESLDNNRTWNAILARARFLNLSLRTINFRKHTFNYRYFENIDTEEKAYWLGFIYADGSISRNRNKEPQGLKITLAVEAEKHLNKFAKAIDYSGEIRGPHYVKYKYKGDIKQSECFSLELCKKEFAEDLINHGAIPNKTYVVQFPKLRKDLIRHFIRGFFDGDGCITDKITRYKDIVYRTASMSITGAVPEFLERIYLEMSNGAGVEFRKAIKHKGSNSTYHIGVQGTPALRVRDWMYENAEIYMECKKDKFYSYNYSSKRPRDQKHQEELIDKELSSRGWKRLSPYNGRNSDMIFQCSKNHIFTTKVVNYKAFLWRLENDISAETQGCQICNNEKSGKRQTDIGKKNLNEIIQKKGWKLLSKYSSNDYIILECEHGRKFSRKRNSLRQ